MDNISGSTVTLYAPLEFLNQLLTSKQVSEVDVASQDYMDMKANEPVILIIHEDLPQQQTDADIKHDIGDQTFIDSDNDSLTGLDMNGYIISANDDCRSEYWNSNVKDESLEYELDKTSSNSSLSVWSIPSR